MTKKIIKIVFCLSLMIGPVAFAQDVATEEAGPTVEQTTLWEMVKQGGWAMWPLGLMSTAMVYFIVQNGLALREKYCFGQI